MQFAERAGAELQDPMPPFGQTFPVRRNKIAVPLQEALLPGPRGPQGQHKETRRVGRVQELFFLCPVQT